MTDKAELTDTRLDAKSDIKSDPRLDTKSDTRLDTVQGIGQGPGEGARSDTGPESEDTASPGAKGMQSDSEKKPPLDLDRGSVRTYGERAVSRMIQMEDKGLSVMAQPVKPAKGDDLTAKEGISDRHLDRVLSERAENARAGQDRCHLRRRHRRSFKELLDTVELRSVPIFRAGSYPQGKFDIDYLYRIADNYDPAFHEAPMYIAHNSSYSRNGRADLSLGWVKRLFVKGNTLFADIRDVPKAFAELILAGRIKKRSVEIYPDLEGKGPYLRAIAWPLIPQVKGLADLHPTQLFGEDERDYLTIFQRSSLRSRLRGRGQFRSFDETNLRDNCLPREKRAVFAEGKDRSDEDMNMDTSVDVNMDTSVDMNIGMKDKKGSRKRSRSNSRGERKALSEKASNSLLSKDELTRILSDHREGILSELRNMLVELEISNFCDQMVLSGKMSPAERELEEPLLCEQRKRELSMNFSESRSESLSSKRMDYWRSRSPIVDLKGGLLEGRSDSVLSSDRRLAIFFGEHRDFFERFGISLDDLLLAERLSSGGVNPLTE